MNDYYVYVYIDPRNHEEFYYGKGRGSRKESHLRDEADTKKTTRIAKIRAVGEKPTIRVIACDLSEEEAFLIEATLLWKSGLGKNLTNQVAGHFSGHFRPHDTLHRDMPRFDFQNGLYYFNVGHGKHRKWDDCRCNNFISAGQGARWRDAILKFKTGDVFAAYLKGRGFVGIGRIREPARRVAQITIKGLPLITLCPTMAENSDSDEKSEYVALVDWIQAVPGTKSEAKMKRRAGLYTTTHVRASLDRQPKTVAFLEQAFGVSFEALLK